MNVGEDFPNGPRRPREWWLSVAVIVLAAFILATAAWASYHAPLRNDQYQLIQLGQTIYNGGRIYVDCWENKPPGLAWINALGFVLSSGDPLGPWLLPVMTAALGLTALWIAAGRLFNIRTGRWVVLIAALAYGLRIYDTPSINPDFYASVFELAGCDSGAATSSRVSIVHAMAAGLFWSAATSCKQVGCVGLIAITLVALGLTVARSSDSRAWWRSVSLAWIGFLIGVGAVTGVLAYRHTLGDAWGAIVTFNLRFADRKVLLAALAGRRVRADLAPLAPFNWLALLGLAVTMYAGAAGRMSRAMALAMLLWWFAAVALALQGPSGSMRYWQATFAPMFWLAGAGLYHIQKAGERLKHAERLTFLAVAITALVMLMSPTLEDGRAGLATSYLHSIEHPNERDGLVEIGRRVQELAPPREPIYVWGYDAGVYVYSDRPAASRFSYPRSAAQMDTILSDLEKNRASLLLIPKRRAPEFESFCDETCHQRLTRILEGYHSVDPLGPYSAWVRSGDGRHD